MIKMRLLKISTLILFFVILAGLANALQINDTIFHSTVSNYTIYVDTITLSNVTVTNISINFYNVISETNFTNVNETYDAIASFYGLEINLSVYNVNTSTSLFTSTIGSQDYNATFTSGEVIQTLYVEEEEEFLGGYTVTYRAPDLPKIGVDILGESGVQVLIWIPFFIFFLVILILATLYSKVKGLL